MPNENDPSTPKVSEDELHADDTSHLETEPDSEKVVAAEEKDEREDDDWKPGTGRFRRDGRGLGQLAPDSYEGDEHTGIPR